MGEEQRPGGCVTVRVFFLSGGARHEIPLATIESVFVVPARAKDTHR